MWFTGHMEQRTPHPIPWTPDGPDAAAVAAEALDARALGIGNTLVAARAIKRAIATWQAGEQPSPSAEDMALVAAEAIGGYIPWDARPLAADAIGQAMQDTDAIAPLAFEALMWTVCR